MEQLDGSDQSSIRLFEVEEEDDAIMNLGLGDIPIDAVAGSAAVSIL